MGALDARSSGRDLRLVPTPFIWILLTIAALMLVEMTAMGGLAQFAAARAAGSITTTVGGHAFLSAPLAAALSRLQSEVALGGGFAVAACLAGAYNFVVLARRGRRERG
jgi:hypothetical protein